MVSPAVSNRSLTASEMPAAGCSGRARKIPSVMLAGMRVRDLNWMQLEDYLEGDDRIVLPLGSTEQHAYLSLETDNILAERVSVEAAEPLGVPVLPVLAYGITPLFAAYPGSPSLSAETYLRVVRELLDSLFVQGFRRVLLVNGHGGNMPARQAANEWMAANEGAQAIFHDWWIGPEAAARGSRDRARGACLVDGELPVDAAGRGRAARRAESRRSISPRCERAGRPRCASCSETGRSAGRTSVPTRK